MIEIFVIKAESGSKNVQKCQKVGRKMCKNVKKLVEKCAKMSKKWVEKCVWHDILLVNPKVNKHEKIRTKEIGRMEK